MLSCRRFVYKSINEPERPSLSCAWIMGTKFETPFDRWMRANGIRPLTLALKARLSRPTVLRIRKGVLGTARTRTKLLVACSALVNRRVTELELFEK